MSDTVERALAEMRAGRRVLVLTLTEPGARAMHDRAAALLTDGETARRGVSARQNTVHRQAGGRLEFAPIGSAASQCRGLTLDTVYVDHDELRAMTAPAMMSSDAPAFICCS